MNNIVNLMLNAVTTTAETSKEISGSISNIGGWEIFGRFADIIGLISFAFSLPTYFIAKGTRKAIESHVEKKEFAENIDESIRELKSYYSLIADEKIYDEEILNSIIKTIDSIKINYSSVLKPYHRDINKLKSMCDSAILHLDRNANYNRREIEKKMNIVITELEKGKRRI